MSVTKQLDNTLSFMRTLLRQQQLESALLLYQRAGKTQFLDLPIEEAAAILADWRETLGEYQAVLPYINDESEN
jgi:hypothetical protein